MAQVGECVVIGQREYEIVFDGRQTICGDFNCQPSPIYARPASVERAPRRYVVSETRQPRRPRNE